MTEYRRKAPPKCVFTALAGVHEKNYAKCLKQLDMRYSPYLHDLIHSTDSSIEFECIKGLDYVVRRRCDMMAKHHAWVNNLLPCKHWFWRPAETMNVLIIRFKTLWLEYVTKPMNKHRQELLPHLSEKKYGWNACMLLYQCSWINVDPQKRSFYFKMNVCVQAYCSVGWVRATDAWLSVLVRNTTPIGSVFSLQSYK